MHNDLAVIFCSYQRNYSVEEVYLLISIMHFPKSDNVNIKICSALAEIFLSTSQKLFVDRYLVEEVYMLISIIPFYILGGYCFCCCCCCCCFCFYCCCICSCCYLSNMLLSMVQSWFLSLLLFILCFVVVNECPLGYFR